MENSNFNDTSGAIECDFHPLWKSGRGKNADRRVSKLSLSDRGKERVDKRGNGQRE